MGHTTTALAVGVKVTEAFKAATQDADGEDIWHGHIADAPDSDEFYTGLGYPFALAYGAVYSDDMHGSYSLSELTTAHAEARAAATAKWEIFARWLEARGVQVPPSETLIMQLEV